MTWGRDIQELSKVHLALKRILRKRASTQMQCAWLLLILFLQEVISEGKEPAAYVS